MCVYIGDTQRAKRYRNLGVDGIAAQFWVVAEHRLKPVSDSAQSVSFAFILDSELGPTTSLPTGRSRAETREATGLQTGWRGSLILGGLY